MGLRILHTESGTGLMGQERRVLAEAEGMAGRKHTVILAVQPGSALDRHARERGLPVEPISMQRSAFLQVVGRLRRVIDGNGIEIINTHSSFDSWAGTLAARLSRRRPWIIRTRHKSTPVSKTPLEWILYQKLIHRVITTGEKVREDLIRRNGLREDRIVSIPTGVDLRRFVPSPEDGRIRKELGIPREDALVGTISFLRSEKGLPDFIQAARQVLDQRRGISFLIVGDGPERSRLEQMIREMRLSEKVVLAGHRDDIPRVLSALDLFVLSSVSTEGLSQAVTQALAMERAVVATSVGAIPEVIRDGETGLLVPPGDPTAIADRILLLLEDRPTVEKFGKAGRRLVEEQYSHERMLDQIEAVYDRLCEGRRPAPWP